MASFPPPSGSGAVSVSGSTAVPIAIATPIPTPNRQVQQPRLRGYHPCGIGRCQGWAGPVWYRLASAGDGAGPSAVGARCGQDL